MSRKFHLFNCDNTYKLEPVEELLAAVTKKLGIHVGFTVEKHRFRLAQMSDIVNKTIPTLEMDVAFFVVHAHESRLSINEDNAGIGYANIYRSLLKETGGNVIIVIGGDDNYKDEDEENRDFISRWAKRKISSQFSEEVLDGRKSFIFSWNKKHREIHEVALQHFFDPAKKGQKFRYQPPPRKLPPIPGTPPPIRPREPTPPLRRCNSLGEKQKYDSELLSRLKSSWHGEETTVRLTAVEEGEQSQQNRLSDSGNRSIYRNRPNAAPSTGHQRAGSKEMPPPSTGKTTDLAIFGCNVSPESMAAVMEVFEKLVPRMNLSEDPVVDNLQPDEVKRYLMANRFKFCVLVVDASTVKNGSEKKKSSEYQHLLETAEDKVAAKVVILVCNRDTLNLSSEEEYIINETIERIVSKRGKGLVVELRNGRLAVDPDVLISFLIGESSRPNEQMGRSRDFHQPASNAGSLSADLCPFIGVRLQRDPLEGERSYGKGAQHIQQLASQAPAEPPRLVLKGLARYGKISYRKGDLHVWYPEFEIPDNMKQRLYQRYGDTPVIGVRIIQKSDGTVEGMVDPMMKEFLMDKEIRLNTDQTLVLKTRVRNGEVSFDKRDVQFLNGNFKIPPNVIDGFRREGEKKPYGNLYIIVDKTGNFQCVVKSGIADRASSYAAQKKEQFDAWRRI